MPEYRNKPINCRHQRSVQFYLNKVWDATKRLSKDPKNTGLLENLVKKKEAYKAACNIAAKATIERDIKRMKKNARVNTGRFFQATGMHLKFEGSGATRSVDETLAALNAAEENYVRKGPEFDLNLLQGVFEAKRSCKIKREKGFVEERIRSMKKCDAFYKEHKETLSGPISAILGIIERSRKFPTNCKQANLALLPSRTIFYLDFFPKIIEDCIDTSFKAAMPEETEGQMAYKPDRCGNHCIAIGLDEVENCDQPVINSEWDQVKAFDSAPWGPVVLEYEKHIGWGEFVWDYLQESSYTTRVYDVNRKPHRGFQQRKRGRGFWPGTIKGPTYFSCFQGTNSAMNKSNPIWLWPSKFSDDCSPLAKWDDYLNGGVQNSLDDIWEWSRTNFINFHLSGKKRPMYYVYRKQDQTGIFDAQLKFGDCIFDREYTKRQLGIAIKVFKDSETSNAHGYELEWTGKRPLSPLCYRLQDMKYVWDTDFMRRCTQAYVVGRLQFGSSLYFLRATKASTVRARFDYCMALAATVGLTTPEVVGMFNCKTRRVAETCKNYLELCRYLDLPTLKEMAINDSKSLIRQWFLYDKERFEYDTTQITFNGKIVEKHKMTGVKAKPGTLLYDLYALSQTDVKPRYTTYHNMKKDHPDILAELPKEERWEIVPHWLRDYEMSGDLTDTTREVLGLPKSSFRDRINTFWLVIREKFNVLERYARAVKHLELTPKKGCPVKRLRTELDDSTDEPINKNRRLTTLSCESKIPLRRAKCVEGQMKCWICGYGVKTKQKRVFECCDRISHVLCWKNQPGIGKETPALCHNVKHYMRRDSRFADYSVKFTEVSLQKEKTTLTLSKAIKHKLTQSERSEAKVSRIKPLLFCSVCEKEIETNHERFMKHHLKYECTAIPSPVLRDGFTHSELIHRMAALGTVKIITKHKNKPHTPNEEPSPAVGL